LRLDILFIARLYALYQFKLKNHSLVVQPLPVSVTFVHNFSGGKIWLSYNPHNPLIFQCVKPDSFSP